MSITRFVTADGLPAFLAHLSKSARVLAPVEKPGNKTAVVFEPWKEGKPFTLAKATVPAKGSRAAPVRSAGALQQDQGSQ